MRKITTLLILTLIISCITACGKKNETGPIKIEASDGADNNSKEPTYAITDNNTEQSAQEQNIVEEVKGVEEPEKVILAIDKIDPTVYGVWSDDKGNSYTIYNSKKGAQFYGYDKSIENYVTGEAKTDGKTYLELKYPKQMTEEEKAEADKLIQEQYGATNKSYDENGNEIAEDNAGNQGIVLIVPEGEQLNYEEIFKDYYEIVKYKIDSLEKNIEESSITMKLSGDKQLVMKMYISESSEDLSLETNSIAEASINQTVN